MLKNAKHDTTRCNILNAFIDTKNDVAVWSNYSEQIKTICEKNLRDHSLSSAEQFLFKKHLAVCLEYYGFIATAQSNFPLALDHYNKSLKILEEIGDKKEFANCLSSVGFIYNTKGDLKIALEYMDRSLKIQEELGDKKGISISLNNIGLVYNYKGETPKALEYYTKSLKIQEELGDKNVIATSLNNIGVIYNSRGDINKALEYFAKSLKIREESGDKNGTGSSLNSMGVIFTSQGDFPKALEYLYKSLKLREETGNKPGIATCLNNIGFIYKSQGDPSVTSSKEDAVRAGTLKALDHYNRSLKIREEMGDKSGIGGSLNNIGSIYLKQKNYSMALKYCSSALKFSKEVGYPETIKNAAVALTEIYKATGDHKLALENYELFIKMRDSLNNESTRKASIKSQLKYEYEKQSAADSVAHAKESEIKNVELKRQSAEIRAKKNQQYALFGGLFLVCLFGGFMYNRFKVTQKQKAVIEHQKEIVEEQKNLVEEKQLEILDSIKYARRIQLAQIPTEKRIEQILKKMQSHEG